MKAFFKANSKEELYSFMADILRGKGWTVLEPDAEFIRPIDLARRLQLTPQFVTDRLSYANCPKFEAKRGTTGRLLTIHPTPELISFLTK